MRTPNKQCPLALNNNMITFEQVCQQFGLSPKETRELIKGHYKIEVKSTAPKYNKAQQIKELIKWYLTRENINLL